MIRYRSYVLPFAILLAFLLHGWCATMQFFIPYCIFTILLMNYSAVDIKKMKPTMMDLWLLLFQMFVSLGLYLVMKVSGAGDILAQGLLIIVLCPVAASCVVVSCILGADRERVTTYTIIGNLMVSIVAPLYFSFMGNHPDFRFIDAFLTIFRKTAAIIALPLAVAFLLQRFLPKVSGFLSGIKSTSFYIWAFTLTITLGKTVDFIFLHGKGNETGILILGIASILICALQFAVGKAVGTEYGDRVAGGQMLGQKNVAMGVWMANTFLLPLASVGIALYSIWQNLFNSWQMWRHDREVEGR